MEVIQPGHTYQLANASNPSGEYEQEIKFRKGADAAYPGHAGTTNEEVLEVLIHRTNVLNAQVPSKYNDAALGFMQKALDAFNARTSSQALPVEDPAPAAPAATDVPSGN